MTVYAAFRKQTENMHGFAAGNRTINCIYVNWIGKKVAIADRFVYAGETLVDHAASAEGHVAHFAVAHLAFGQANG